MSARRTTPRGRDGLTLLELVVALSIASLAMVGGYAALGSLVDHRERAVTAAAGVARAAAVRAELIRWLSGVRLTADGSGPQFYGTDGVFADSMPDAHVSFLTVAWTPSGPGQTAVSLYVGRDDTTRTHGQHLPHGLIADLSPWPAPGLVSTEANVTRIVLDSIVDGLDIEYLTGVFGGRRWLPSWISTSVLPAAVSIRLLPLAGDTLPSLLALPIIVPLRGGH